MYRERERVIAIINELANFLLNNKVSSLHIDLVENDEETKICVYCNISNVELLEELKNKIISSRNESLEELYWELLGDPSKENELLLLGNMIDEANIDNIGLNLAKINITRKKKKIN